MLDDNADNDADPTASRLDARLADLVPDGGVPLGFVVCLKYLDADGDICLVGCRSSEVSSWEAVGMHHMAIDEIVTGDRTPPAPYGEPDEEQIG